MAHNYLVDLTETEQAYLLKLIPKGNPSARKVARAQVLLHAAEGATDDTIAPALHLGVSTGHRTRQRCVDEGLMPAVRERPRPGKRQGLTGKQTAFLIALAGSMSSKPNMSLLSFGKVNKVFMGHRYSSFCYHRSPRNTCQNH